MTIDATIRALAPGRHDVVSKAELLAAGASLSAIQRALASGRLRLLHPAAYYAGTAPDPPLPARVRAVLLTVPGDPAASHRTGAELRELLTPAGGPCHVTVPGRTRSSKRGIVVHRGPVPRRVGTVDGLRVADVETLLLGLAATEDEATLQRALNEACYRRVVDLGLLATMAVRTRGAARLRRAVGDATRATNPLEDRFFALVRAAGLPTPVGQRKLGPFVVDFHWPELRLIVETDGWAGHGHALARRRDPLRDAYFAGRGIHTHRVPRRAVERGPYRMIADLSAVIALRAAGLTPPGCAPR